MKLIDPNNKSSLQMKKLTSAMPVDSGPKRKQSLSSVLKFAKSPLGSKRPTARAGVMPVDYFDSQARSMERSMMHNKRDTESIRLTPMSSRHTSRMQQFTSVKKNPSITYEPQATSDKVQNSNDRSISGVAFYAD